MAISLPLVPELNADITAEILLHVAPDEPACLFRASVVSKLWHRILSDPDFRRRYRAFHRNAPLLGFFYNLGFSSPFHNFVATPTASPLRQSTAAPPQNARRVTWALDCRHGRVLFENRDRWGFLVWDPIADDWIDLPRPPGIWYSSYTAAVLCAEAGCDHRDCRQCRGGRFLVVCVGTVDSIVYACVYSSEDRAWCAPVSHNPGAMLHLDISRPALIGDAIYCTIFEGEEILRYDLVRRSFSLIGVPRKYTKHPVLMQNMDGSLGLAAVRDSRLFVWSRRWNNQEEGDAARWVLRRAIKLKKLLPVDNRHCIIANVIGFAEGVDVFIISTNVGVFTVDLNSGRVKRVSNQSKRNRSVVPFISFFTPDCAFLKSRRFANPSSTAK